MCQGRGSVLPRLRTPRPTASTRLMMIQFPRSPRCRDILLHCVQHQQSAKSGFHAVCTLVRDRTRNGFIEIHILSRNFGSNTDLFAQPSHLRGTKSLWPMGASAIGSFQLLQTASMRAIVRCKHDSKDFRLNVLNLSCALVCAPAIIKRACSQLLNKARRASHPSALLYRSASLR